jgi:putative FmdB family regulatory protein
MPTYEYECEKCGKRFDVFQSMSDEPLKKHEKCGGKLKRLISGGAGIIFKGSGFYATDYKNKSSGGGPSKKSSSTEKKTDTAASSSEPKSSDSKPSDSKPKD